MKAFLLCAGLGTRLRPITHHTPKCLVPIGGRPLLAIWLHLFRRCGVTDVLINTHHLAEKVVSYLQGWHGPPAVSVTYEPELLGSAGTLGANWNFVAGDEAFLVCNGDNLTDIDLAELARRHARSPKLVTMAVFRTDRAKECGVVELDGNGEVLTFEEKPLAPRSNLANAGVYVMSTRVRSKLPETRPADIGHDLLPRCAGELGAWVWEGLLLDIGTPEAYARAQKVWRERERAAADGASRRPGI